MSQDKVDEMKIAIRDFFIKNYNHLTYHHDIKTATERSDRYQELLKLYMFLAEYNECRCFNTASDILAAMDMHSSQDRRYIETGELLHHNNTKN